MLATARTSELGALGLTGADMVPLIVRVMRVFPLGWLRDYLRIHYTKAAYARYGYTPRHGERGGHRFRHSYQDNKLKRFGHTLPQVYTGRGRAEALSNNRATATKRRGTAHVSARYLNVRNPHSPIDMRKELSTVTGEENARLNHLAQLKSDAEVSRLAARF